MAPRIARALAGASLVLVLARPCAAQVRTFVTESAAPLGAGEVRLSFGGLWGRDHEEPVYGLQGTLLQAPIVEADFGLGGVAELQVSGGLKTLWIDRRSPDAVLASVLDIPGDRTSAPQDIVVSTKVRILQGRGAKPALSVRFDTKLPNAGNESGLGTDTTDVALLLLATWRGQQWRVTVNLGTATVGDPSQLGVQHDPALYAFALSRTVGERTEVAGEVSGRWLPGHPSRPGSEDRADARMGVRRHLGAWRLDASVMAGLTAIDPSIGVAASVCRTFGPFPP
jgi:hypothetical protein